MSDRGDRWWGWIAELGRGGRVLCLRMSERRRIKGLRPPHSASTLLEDLDRTTPSLDLLPGLPGISPCLLCLDLLALWTGPSCCLEDYKLGILAARMHLNLPLLDLPPHYNTDEDTSVDFGYDTADSSSPTLDLLLTKIAVGLARFLDYSAHAKLLDHISLVLPFQSFLTSEDAMFLLTAPEEATQEDLQRLAINIVGPNNVALPVHTNTPISGSGNLYTFRPVIPGIYTIDVYHSATRPVRGSPLKIMISKNYQRRPNIVHWDLPYKAPCNMFTPWGLCYNTKTEQLWIADRFNHTLIIYKPDGVLDFTVGWLGAGPGEFFRPTALAYDVHLDRIFVSDKDNHRVQIFNAKDGTFLATFGRKGELAGEFLYPIQFFDAAGTYLREFRVTESGGKDFKSVFNFSPRGLAFNLTGDTLYVSDFNLYQVHQLQFKDSELTLRPFISPGILYRPSGLGVDEAGNLIVADTKNNALRVVAPNGVLLRTITVIGSPPHAKANIYLKLPTDVAILPKKGFIAALDDKGRVTVF
ncbi:hypothetical protein Fcan01_12620 [Folsomia candida]|uniref:Uncharacterized protein n=1 Tax=Folsomia candida TaxID=158441 RepID=A0A226E6X3_FOLCA|nr:hypothetical protein Fcan01_12620 [Folsomia candida]